MAGYIHDAKFYKDTALTLAENYGVVDYKVKGNEMIWLVSFPAYLSSPRYTVKHTVNLDIMKEKTEILKRFNVEGYNNR